MPLGMEAKGINGGTVGRKQTNRGDEEIPLHVGLPLLPVYGLHAEIGPLFAH